MDQALATTESHDIDSIANKDLESFVTFYIKGQMFGIPVLQVQDILVPNKIASVPLAPPEVRGSINLRGRIVSVVDVRVRLGLEKRDDGGESMGVTIEEQNELYTLLVDTVGDVVGLSKEHFENSPSTLDPLWREFASGVYRLDKKLMVILNVSSLLDMVQEE
ncbi:MAG: chemotaxis protein CheW [Alphaproteobacteria bacterium]